MIRAALLVALLAGCPPAPKPVLVASIPDPGQARGPAPRLVVLLVVDQLPAWAFEAKRAALTGGFDRLLREGEWHTGQHPSAATITAPGHALLGSGQPPSQSGILANSWWDRTAAATVEAVRDTTGAITTAHLRVPGLADSIAAAGTGAKAVSVSLKDRAAILVLGHAGIPIWYDPKAVAWTSTASPAWLPDYNRTHPIAAHFKAVWTPLDADRMPALTGVADAQPGEVGDRGFGPTFPHDLGATKDPGAAIFATPMGNDVVLDTATAAIDAEQLGADDVPDLLVISLSANDYIGHAWGHESWEAWDSLLRLDRRLDQLLTDLDTKVGVDRWAMIVTSDHGASPMPRGAISYEQIKDAANHAAIAELGPGEWIADAHYPTVYLTPATLAQKPRELKQVLKKIVFALRSFPGLERVELTSDFAGHCETRTGDAFLLCLTLDPVLSGEVIYLPAKGWIVGPAGEPHATAHGSLQPYDRLVPVIMLPPGRTSHLAMARPNDTTVNMLRVATVLARWLGVTPPSNLHP